ncbi:MAG: hypothetical protein QOI98_3664 [Solirubrobacteraceae bacterium]|jgi:cell division protein FtsW (lipid II flippase)|nr:hypothetical protein [Solirubrobacteraceae bacterium]
MQNIEHDPATIVAPQRHGCLTAILIVFGLLSALAALANLVLGDAIARNLPNAPEWAPQGVMAMGVLGIIAVTALVGLWFWKKWALYLYIVMALVVCSINFRLAGVGPSIMGLIGAALVALFVLRQWDDFK